MNASLHNRKLITVYVVRLPTAYKKNDVVTLPHLLARKIMTL